MTLSDCSVYGHSTTASDNSNCSQSPPSGDLNMDLRQEFTLDQARSTLSRMCYDHAEEYPYMVQNHEHSNAAQFQNDYANPQAVPRTSNLPYYQQNILPVENIPASYYQPYATNLPYSHYQPQYNEQMSMMNCKSVNSFNESPSSYPGFATRVVTNLRKRERNLNINKAFDDLRVKIPNLPTDTKVSKIKILRLAADYIRHLNKILDEENATNKASETELNVCHTMQIDCDLPSKKRNRDEFQVDPQLVAVKRRKTDWGRIKEEISRHETCTIRKRQEKEKGDLHDSTSNYYFDFCHKQGLANANNFYSISPSNSLDTSPQSYSSENDINSLSIGAIIPPL